MRQFVTNQWVYDGFRCPDTMWSAIGPLDCYVKYIYGSPPGSSFLAKGTTIPPANTVYVGAEGNSIRGWFNIAWEGTLNQLGWTGGSDFIVSLLESGSNRTILSKKIKFGTNQDINFPYRVAQDVPWELLFDTDELITAAGAQMIGTKGFLLDFEPFAKYGSWGEDDNDHIWLYSGRYTGMPAGTGTHFVYIAYRYVGAQAVSRYPFELTISTQSGECGTGYHLEGGVCVPDAPTIVCPIFTQDCYVGVGLGEIVSPTKNITPTLIVDNQGPAGHIWLKCRSQGHEVTLISSIAIAGSTNGIELSVPARNMNFYTGKTLDQITQVDMTFKVGPVGGVETSAFVGSVAVAPSDGGTDGCPTGYHMDDDKGYCVKDPSSKTWLIVGGVSAAVLVGSMALLAKRKRG